ncbi:glycerophosphodiester phosphodiesterase [Paenibacillus arenilitoris]|uniref:Glycerophosphodiester phosphodiesterase n=1 Tax=Paenibacillus arenilitoris TaxID=2772299 RepID=A0A927CP67_9BACL|nr:glycerophosphodiester phosphodiesterase [Paenibacillus arenilitoris]MBD2869185.1 glycerophosphodiester phosphodiesterase [Paenibacillus arenilitoris]
MKSLINFAHRGASAYCPENTIAAFKKALELGATGIETDVQLTKDGRVVVIHDESLARTAGLNRLVKDTGYDELQTLDAGGWFAPEFRGERIPSLEQLLLLVSDTGTIVNIELKNGYVQYPGLEQKVIDLVREHQMTERVVISSFNHYSLALCKQLAPEIRTGILYMEGLYRPWDYAMSLHADALHAFKPAVTAEWVAEAAAHGIDYHPFTVNDREEMERLIDCGVAGIITDYPDRLAEALTGRGAGSA